VKAYTIKIKKTKTEWIASDNVSAVFGVGETSRIAFEDYEHDVTVLLGECAHETKRLSAGIRSECDALRAARS